MKKFIILMTTIMACISAEINNWLLFSIIIALQTLALLKWIKE